MADAPLSVGLQYLHWRCSLLVIDEAQAKELETTKGSNRKTI
jgi:hypothetical protein